MHRYLGSDRGALAGTGLRGLGVLLGYFLSFQKRPPDRYTNTLLPAQGPLAPLPLATLSACRPGAAQAAKLSALEDVVRMKRGGVVDVVKATGPRTSK